MKTYITLFLSLLSISVMMCTYGAEHIMGVPLASAAQVPSETLTLEMSTTTAKIGESVAFTYLIGSNYKVCTLYISHKNGGWMPFGEKRGNAIYDFYNGPTRSFGSKSFVISQEYVRTNGYVYLSSECYNSVSRESIRKEFPIRITTKTTTTDVLPLKNIVYKWSQKLDVHLPEGVSSTSPRPVYLLVHGWGWIGWDKESDLDISKGLFQKGAAIVSLDYSISTPDFAGVGVVYGEIDCALQWIYQHRKRYNFDENSINLIGGSAGWHLVLQYALYQWGYHDASCPSQWDIVKLNQVVAMAWPTDLTKDFSRTDAGDINYAVARFLGESYGTTDFFQRAKQNSPVNYLNKFNTDIVYYLVHSKTDGIVNFSDHATPLYQSMREKGYSVIIDTNAVWHNASTLTDATFVAILDQSRKKGTSSDTQSTSTSCNATSIDGYSVPYGTNGSIKVISKQSASTIYEQEFKCDGTGWYKRGSEIVKNTTSTSTQNTQSSSTSVKWQGACVLTNLPIVYLTPEGYKGGLWARANTLWVRKTLSSCLQACDISYKASFNSSGEMYCHYEWERVNKYTGTLSVTSNVPPISMSIPSFSVNKSSIKAWESVAFSWKANGWTACYTSVNGIRNTNLSGSSWDIPVLDVSAGIYKTQVTCNYSGSFRSSAIVVVTVQ